MNIKDLGGGPVSQDLVNDAATSNGTNQALEIKTTEELKKETVAPGKKFTSIGVYRGVERRSEYKVKKEIVEEPEKPDNESPVTLENRVDEDSDRLVRIIQ